MDAEKGNYPVLIGYRIGPSVKVWCPFCAKWHDHGYTDDLEHGKTSLRVADCDYYGAYGSNYNIRILMKSEVKEILKDLPEDDRRKR
ncbi:MAG: hypothetical protein JW902_15960 [Syntrophaceae bacterium]|nr:hypothetical protein [Syntrophaceae bacterium]